MHAAADFLQDSATVGAAVDLLRRQDCRHVVGHWRCHRRIHGLERRTGKPAADRQLATQLAAGVGFTDGVERAWDDSLRSCCACREAFDAMGGRRRPQALVTGRTMTVEFCTALLWEKFGRPD